MPRGRERILDEGKQREVCALVSSGCSLQAAAHYVECATNTIRREAARNPDFGRRFREARLQAQISPLQAMRKASASHWRAAAWMLERSDPDHFARRPAPAFRPKQAQVLRDDILAILNTEIDNPNQRNRLRRQIQQLMEYSIDGVVRVERTDRDLRSVRRLIDELERQDEKAAHDVAFREPPKEPPKEKSSSMPSETLPSAAKSNAKSNRSSGPTVPSAPGAPKSAPTNAPQPSNPEQPSNPKQLDPEIADIPVTWGDMTTVFQQLRSSIQNADGKPAADPGANGAPATVHSADGKPTAGQSANGGAMAVQSANGKPTADPANVPSASADSPPRPVLPLRAYHQEVRSSIPDP